MKYTLLSLFLLTSCAAGSATAGYALKAQYADNLSACAEQRIVDRTKAEIMYELRAQENGYYAR
jgi:hypothetical protein